MLRIRVFCDETVIVLFMGVVTSVSTNYLSRGVTLRLKFRLVDSFPLGWSEARQLQLALH